MQCASDRFPESTRIGRNSCCSRRESHNHLRSDVETNDRRRNGYSTTSRIRQQIETARNEFKAPPLRKFRNRPSSSLIVNRSICNTKAIQGLSSGLIRGKGMIGCSFSILESESPLPTLSLSIRELTSSSVDRSLGSSRRSRSNTSLRPTRPTILHPRNARSPLPHRSPQPPS